MGLKYGMLEVHTTNYQELANKTWNSNKVEYCKRHGYQTFEVIPTGDKIRPLLGYCKMHAIKEVFLNNPKLEWLWYTGTDSMITNFNIKIEDRIDNDYHFIVPVDMNGLNADSLLWRNTPEGRAFLDDVLALEEIAPTFGDSEQGALNRLCTFPGTCVPWKGNEKIPRKYRKVIKVVPNRRMNSYDYSIWGDMYLPPRNLDQMYKKRGNWEPGDWLIHWPGTSYEARLQFYDFYNQWVIK